MQAIQDVDEFVSSSEHIWRNLALHLHLADTFIQSDLPMRTIEAIKTNKRATTCKCMTCLG